MQCDQPPPGSVDRGPKERKKPMKRPRRLLFLQGRGLGEFRSLPALYDPVGVQGWELLLEMVAREPPSTLVVVPSLAERQWAPEPRVRRLVRVAPMVPVLPAVLLRPENSAVVAAMVEWGATQLLDLEFEGEEAPEMLLARLASAHAQPFKRRFQPLLSRFVPHRALTLIWAGCDVVVDGGLSRDLARTFGVRGRTVGEWCAREGLPPPKRLLVWLRLLLALALLEEPGRSVWSAALGAGFSTDSSLRRVIRLLLGDSGGSCRAWSFEAAARVFDAELRRIREEQRPMGRKDGER